jgi:Transposase DDE domain
VVIGVNLRRLLLEHGGAYIAAMTPETLTREWQIITGLLPEDWREQARNTGALVRGRKVKDADALLLLILLHVATGLSLVQAAARARRMGIADISGVALHKRLRGAAAWMHSLASAMYAQSPFRRALDVLPLQRRVRVVDATHIQEPGSAGPDWRLHYVLQLPSLECDFFEITDASGGESFKRIPTEPGDLILGDRGYSRRDGIAHVIDAGGEVIVRLNQGNVPLLEPAGARFDLLHALRTLVDHEPGEWAVSFTRGQKTYPLRLCAVRKSEVAAERARTRLLRRSRKAKQKARPETIETAGYVFVLTSLGSEVPPAQVLELYRARWQIELAFKRMKSLFAVGHVPKYDPVSARAWLHAKLLSVLLIERLTEQARIFSPWGFSFPRQPLEVVR